MGTTATQEHPNATLIREGLEAFNRRDMQAYADLVADDIVWHQIGSPEPMLFQASFSANQKRHLSPCLPAILA